MNISVIKESLISQNAIRSTGKADLAVDDKLRQAPVQTSQAGSGVSPVESRTAQVQGLTAGINYMKEQLDEILISYPPFFPLGTYQRLDLIKKIHGLQDEVQKSSIDANLKETFAENKLPEHATDLEISAALDGLLGLRDTLTKDKSASSEKAQPGAILDIKV